MKTSGSRTRRHGTKPSLISIGEFQKHVPVGLSTIGKMIRTGKLDTRKICGRRMIVTTSAEELAGVTFNFADQADAAE